MPTALANGIEINYADSGGDGPAVVLSHGFLMDASMFDAQVAALAPEYRVITWDARGHGGTWAPGPGRARPAVPPRHRAGRPRRHVSGRLPQPARRDAGAGAGARPDLDRQP